MTPSFYRYHLKKPSVLLVIVAVMSTILLVGLGQWQLRRYHEKKQWVQNLEERRVQTQSLAQILAKSDRNFYRVHLSGVFDNKRQFLLDNKTENGEVGYHVITPLILSDNQAVLINRGFIAMPNLDRRQLPSIAPVTEHVTLDGFVRMTEKPTYALSKNVMEIEQWPIRMQTVDVDQIKQITHYDIPPLMVLVAPESPHGFKRNWQWISTPPSKHIGYALQWFSFAVILWLVIIAAHLVRNDSDAS